jgi:hypothetical protein
MKKANRKSTEVSWFLYTGKVKKKKFNRRLGSWFLEPDDSVYGNDGPTLCVVQCWDNTFIRVEPGQIVVYDDYTEEFEALDEHSFHDLYDVKD